MSTKKTKKPKQRSVHEMELAEVAWITYWGLQSDISWDPEPKVVKEAWRAAVKAVLEEAIYRVEADINSK